MVGGPPTYIPSLDGWRAIAILSVMALHDEPHYLGPLSDAWFSDYGGLGVRIFFAISGILICSRILDEEDRAGGISLRDFYIRRAFRILPPAVLFLLVAACLIAVGHSQEPWHIWWASMLFCRNFFQVAGRFGEGWITSHFWSLSLEEQFYLILPATLIFAGKRRAWVLGTLIFCCYVWSAYVGRHLPNVPLNRPDIALNVLLIPAFVAILLRNARCRKAIAALVRPWPIYAALIYITQAPQLFISLGIRYPGHFYDQLLALLMTALVLSTAMHSKIWLARVLETAPLRWIGRISYSLYLWQQLFLTQHFAPSETIGWAYHYHLDWPLSFLCATVSYYLLERPFIRLGHKLSRNRIPGRPEDFDPPTSPRQSVLV